MLKISNTILFFVSIILIQSCNKNDDVTVIQKYLTEDLHTEITNPPHLYIFLPHDMCGSCLSGLIDYADTIEENNTVKLTYVFIGRSQKSLVFLTEEMDKRHNIIYDGKGIAYEKNIIKHSTPTLMEILAEKTMVHAFSSNDYYAITKSINTFIEGH